MATTRSRRLSAGPTIGSQTPTKLVVPEYAYSEWQECHDVCKAGGVDLIEWQDGILAGWLGRSLYGKWAASVCGLSVPRQNGKSLGVVEPRINYGMIVHGETVLYTAQLQKTATETFEDMANFFEQPKLKKYVKDIKYALGREQIILKNGGRVKFLARTRNGGRGQHGDLLVFDEALELSDEDQASFLPAISASANPQTIYASSPPDEAREAHVFRAIRERALNGISKRTAWAEWGVDEVGNLSDKSRWYATNPSLGILISEDTVDGEFEQMTPETFAIERLGWWPPVAQISNAIDPIKWAASATSLTDGDDGLPLAPKDEEIAKLAVGVKFAADGGRVCVAIAALKRSDDVLPSMHVELLFDESTFEGLEHIVSWCVERKDRVALVSADGRAGGQDFCDNLRKYGMPKKAVHLMTSSEVVSAATKTVNALNENRLTHHPDKILDNSATTAEKRKIGNDGYGFGGESLPIEAAAAAIWAVATTKRNPMQGEMIG